MAIDLLNDEAHSKLLEKLKGTPLDKEGQDLKESLEVLFKLYRMEIGNLFQIISVYENLAERVRLRQCAKDN